MRLATSLLASLIFAATIVSAVAQTAPPDAPHAPPQRQAPPPPPNLLLPPGTLPIAEQTAAMLMVYLSDRPGTAAELKLQIQQAALKQQQNPAMCPVPKTPPAPPPAPAATDPADK